MVDTPHSAVRKSDKIRQIVNEHTSAESQKTVESILDQVANIILEVFLITIN